MGFLNQCYWKPGSQWLKQKMAFPVPNDVITYASFFRYSPTQQKLAWIAFTQVILKALIWK